LSTLTIDQILKVGSIFSEKSLNGILEKSVNLIPNIFNWKGCSIFLYDENNDVIKLAKTSGLTGAIDRKNGEIIYERNEGLTGWVFDKKKPLLIRDLNKKSNSDLARFHPGLRWKGKYSEADSRKAKSFMAVPLVSQNGQLLGVMRAVSDDYNFKKSDLDVFMLIANYVSLALDNYKYIMNERRKSEYLELLMKVGTQILSFFELDDLLRFVAENTAKTISSETCEIYLRDEYNKERLVLRAGYGIPEELINVAEHKIGEGLTGTIVKENRTIRSKNVLTLPYYKGKYRNAIKGHLKYGDRLTFLGMPIKIKDEPIGAIKLYNKIPKEGGPDYFTEDDEKYLRILVDMLSVAIENVQYLETIKLSALKTLKSQRLTALGTLAVRIPNDIGNPLVEAQLGIGSIVRKFEKDPKALPPEELIDRLRMIGENLKKVSQGIRVLQDFSTKAGYHRIKCKWGDLIDESLLLVKSELFSKKINVERNRSEEANLPETVLDPNEITEVLVTLISIAVFRLKHYGSTLKIGTIRDREKLRIVIEGKDNKSGTEIPRRSVEEKVVGAKSYKPYQFSLDIAREVITTNYGGRIDFQEEDSCSKLILEIPMRA